MYFIIVFLLHHNTLSFNNKPPTIFSITIIPEIKPDNILFSLLDNNMSDPIFIKL